MMLPDSAGFAGCCHGCCTLPRMRPIRSEALFRRACASRRRCGVSTSAEVRGCHPRRRGCTSASAVAANPTAPCIARRGAGAPPHCVDLYPGFPLWAPKYSVSFQMVDLYRYKSGSKSGSPPGELPHSARESCRCGPGSGAFRPSQSRFCRISQAHRHEEEGWPSGSEPSPARWSVARPNISTAWPS